MEVEFDGAREGVGGFVVGGGAGFVDCSVEGVGGAFVGESGGSDSSICDDWKNDRESREFLLKLY